FVVMSLASIGLKEHPVARRGIQFLKHSMREDGSWPIDTNLATWVTTLAINSRMGFQPVHGRWLLDQQYKTEHPYTHSAPGGWAWTDLSGGVPDADDTSGALLALKKLAPEDEQVRRAAEAGVRWLVELQNRDGGFPTFCRGWGALPFDKSCTDLTGHALRAISAWSDTHDDVIQRGLAYLRNQQRADGSWIPLWFGNQHTHDQENPVLGTSRVLMALSALKQGGVDIDSAMMERAVAWLVSTQAEDGGWGGGRDAPPSVEETALAVDALARCMEQVDIDPGVLIRGVNRLLTEIESSPEFVPQPIGLYFARLWYYEDLYPLVFTRSALAEATDLSTIFST
ncbi:MAG: prenyltransferase/squalene oxidase repeat-containing protein, partial [Verrucomicrobiota bacterium]